MARKSPAFSFYPDSWVLGTMSMSFEDQGVYLRMLCFQWANGPADANAYANACGDAYVSHVNRILERKFTCVDGLYQNDRLEAERAKQSDRSDAAKTAANSRWSKKNDANVMRTHMRNGCERNANAYANAMPSDSDSDSDSISNTEKNNTDVAVATCFVYPELFEKFWAAFPRGRKGDKGKALTAWKKALKKAPAALIISAAEEYAKSEVGQGDFVKGPCPWLNGSCWDDDREAWRNKSGTVNPRQFLTKLQQQEENMRQTRERLVAKENQQNGQVLIGGSK